MPLTPLRSQLIIALALCAGVAQSRAQEEDYRQSIGGSLSVGSKISKDADFWGWSLDYARVLPSGWTLSISLAYDEETEERRNQSDKVTQTYTPTVAWTYPVSPRWAVGAGVGKGIINDDNKDGKFEFTKLKDEWAVGATATFLLWGNGRHRATLSSALEYDISDGDPSISFDIGYAYGF